MLSWTNVSTHLKTGRLTTKRLCINMECLCMHIGIRKTAEVLCRYLRISCQTELSVSQNLSCSDPVALFFHLI
jgi:hypothetical protein